MKKQLVLLAMLTTLFISCKKEKDGPKNPTFQKDEGFTNRTIASGMNVLIAKYILTVGAMDGFIFIPDFYVAGSTVVPFKNFYFTVKRSDSSLVYKAPARTISQYYVDSHILLEKDARYSVAVYADISPGSIGMVNVQCQTRYEWVGGTGVLEKLAGQETMVTPYKSTPTLTHIPLTGLIVDSVEAKQYEFSIAGKTAHKQFAFAVQVADNGANDTLSLSKLKCFEDGVDVTSKVTFMDGNGTPISVITENTGKIFVTYTAGSGETVVDGTRIFSLKATPSGFHHPNDGDGYSLQLITDQNAVPDGYWYLNRGSSGSHAKLSSTATASGSAIAGNLIWSDMSAGSHSALFGISSNDWANGYKIPALPMQIWHQ
ncbi:MAG TPA: hypothetical protein VLB02_01775 [Candidatus Paceibacterota bacterium]|nr:hypothetical protein [Candidatus Paceibacterota bacterium]